MNIYPVTNDSQANSGQVSEVDLWLAHGEKLGATHAILYFDRYDQTQAMGYAFPKDDLKDVIRRIEMEQLSSIIQCWEYQR